MIQNIVFLVILLQLIVVKATICTSQAQQCKFYTEYSSSRNYLGSLQKEIIDKYKNSNQKNNKQNEQLSELVIMNQELTDQIYKQILGQLNDQIKDDETATLTIENQVISLNTSKQIIIQDLYIYDSIFLNRINILSAESVQVRNITIIGQKKPIFLPVIDPNAQQQYWMVFSKIKNVFIDDIYIDVVSSNNEIAQVDLFSLSESNNANLKNITVLYYSQKFIDLIAGNLSIEKIHIESIDLGNDSPFINTLSVNQITLQDLVIINNNLFKKSLFNLTNSKSVRISGAKLIGNLLYCSSKDKCTIIDINAADLVDISQFSAFSNYAQQGYAVFQSTQNQQLIMINCNISKNIFSYELKGGIFKASSKNFNSQIVMMNCNITENGSSDQENIFEINEDNVSTYKAVQLDFPVVQINNSNFKNNVGGAIEIMNVNSLRSENATFENNIAFYGSGITARTNSRESQFVFIRTNFTSNKAICSMQGNGAAMNIDYLSSLSIQDSFITNNEANPGIYGGGIFFQEIETILIDNSKFLENLATKQGGAIYGKVVSDIIVIISSQFTKNIAYEIGGAINIDQIATISVIQSQIESNIAYQNGGFLSSYRIIQKLNFIFSSFVTNQAVQSTGGVVYVYSMVDEINISNSQITNNFSNVGGVFGIDFIGLLNIEGLNDIGGQTLIEQNLATIGGAFFFQNFISIVVDGEPQANLDNVITGNHASQSGDDYFSNFNDVKIKKVLQMEDGFQTDCERELQVVEIQSDDKEILRQYVIKNAKSNSFIKLKFFLSDSHGQPINFKNKANYQGEYDEMFQNKTSQSYLAQINIDSENNNLATEKIQEISNNVFCYNQDEEQNTFDLSYKMNFRPNTTLNTTLVFFSQIQSSKSIKIIWEFRECEIGEIYISQGGLPMCYSCPNHTYSFQDPYNNRSCLPIPTKGVKESYKNVLILEEGFWRESQASSDIIECTNSRKFCLGGEYSGNLICEQGHIGPLCEQCDLTGQYWNQSYTQNHGNECSLCSDISNNTVKLVLTSLALIIFTAIVCRSAYKNTLNTILGNYMKRIGLGIFGNSIIKQNLFGIYAKLFLSFLQISQVISLFKVRQYGFFNVMMNTLSQPVNASMMSLDCFLNEKSQSSILFLKVNIDYLQDYLLNYFLKKQNKKLILVSVLPFGFILLITFFFAILYLFGLISSLQRKYSLFTTIFYSLISLLQFNIVLFLLEAQACREIGSSSFAYLDLSLNCENEKLTSYRNFLVYPLLILWILVFPVGLLAFLWNRRYQLFRRIRMQFKFRFLYTEYKEKFFYWEFMRLYIRVAIAFLSTEFYEQSSISGLTSLFILIVYETLLIKFQPFLSNQINYLEAESIFIAMFTLFLSMIYDNLVTQQDSTGLSYNFWDQPTALMCLIIFFIQAINFYFIFKYMYLSIYALIEHHRFVKKLEEVLRRTFPVFTSFICKKRVNTVKVSMQWSLVKKLITKGQVSMVMMKLKQYSLERDSINHTETSLFCLKNNSASLRETNSQSGYSTKNHGFSQGKIIQTNLEQKSNFKLKKSIYL